MSSHFISALKLATSTIDGIVDSSVEPNIETILAGGDSLQWNTWASIESHRPQARFTTVKIGNAITTLGLAALAITESPLEIYTVLATHKGDRAATGDKINVTDAIVVPMTLEAAIGGAPTLSYGVFMGKEDGTAPYAVTTAQTIPTGLTVDELWRIGDVDVNSSSIGPVIGWTIDFGYQVEQDIDPESLYPTLVIVKLGQPRITIRTKSPTAIDDITLAGSSNVVALTLQARTIGGGIAATGHKVFSTHQNVVHVNSLGGSHGERAITEITCEPVFDGTNNPVTVA